MDAKKTDWVGLLGGNERRGGSSAGRRESPGELVWRVALPEAVRSSPVVSLGVVYMTCRDGRLYAFDARTGRERWTFKADAPLH
nr:PQQ-binding-like beta-propeller repeat protein [Acidobacteriota bacterium]